MDGVSSAAAARGSYCTVALSLLQTRSYGAWPPQKLGPPSESQRKPHLRHAGHERRRRVPAAAPGPLQQHARLEPPQAAAAAAPSWRPLPAPLPAVDAPECGMVSGQAAAAALAVAAGGDRRPGLLNGPSLATAAEFWRRAPARGSVTVPEPPAGARPAPRRLLPCPQKQCDGFAAPARQVS